MSLCVSQHLHTIHISLPRYSAWELVSPGLFRVTGDLLVVVAADLLMAKVLVLEGGVALSHFNFLSNKSLYVSV